MKKLYLKILILFLGLIALNNIASAANYDWDASTTAPSLTIANTTGCALTTYTFSQTTFNNANAKIVIGKTVTIVFPAGVNLATCTTAGSTFKGTAIASWTITGQTITFTAPVAVAKNVSFDIVIANVTNGNNINGQATVTVGNNSGGVNQTNNAGGTPVVDYQVTTTTCPVAPSNDNCGSPIVLTPAAAGSAACTTTNGTTFGATASPQAVCTGQADDDVWYRFTANNANHQVTVDGVAGFNAVLEVLSGACGSPTSMQCVNVTGSDGVETANLTGLSIGTQYFIRIYHNGAGAGVLAANSFTVCVTSSNSVACSGFTGTDVTVASLPYTAAGQTNCGAADNITSSNSTVCGSSLYYGGEDMVYKFTPASSGNISVNITSTSTYVGAVIYQGCPTAGGTCVAYSQSSTGNQSIGCAPVTASQTYYLVVDSWPTPNCHPTYSVNITAPAGGIPLGTTCGNPLPVTLPYSATGQSTMCFGDEITNANNGGTATSYQSGEDKVYTFTTTGSECIAISCTNASTSFIGWHVYNGCPNSGGTLVGRMEGATVGACSGSVTVPGAGTYYLVVDTWSTPSSVNYDISISSLGGGPSNDAPCGAISIALGSTVSGDNNCSSTEAPAAPACWSTGTMNTVWFKAVAPASGKLVIKASAGSLANPQIAVYSGASCSGALTMVAGGCNDDQTSCGSFSASYDSQLSLTGLTNGTTYYIRVDGYSNQTGTFSVFVQDGNISLPPIPGQDCSDPNPVCNVLTQVSNPGYNGYGNICDLPTTYCLGSGERHIVWYRVPISGSGTLNMDIVPNDFNNTIEDETDYDFAVWEITDQGSTVATCAQIAAGSATPDVCNYSYMGVTGIGAGGNPPANLTTGTNVCPQCTPASYNPSNYSAAYEPTLSVDAGDVYLVAVSNFSNSTSGFRLRFTGTATIDFASAVSAAGGLTWSGGDISVPNLWSDVDNWGGCAAPDCSRDAYIQNFSNQPILANTLATPFNTDDIVIGPGATLTLNAGATLEVCGNFTNNGTINAHPNSYIIFKGTGTQTISGSLTGTNKFGNVIIFKSSGTVVAGADMEIGGTFYSANNTSIFNSNGKYITLGGNFSNYNGSTTFTNIGSTGTLEFNGTGSQIYAEGASTLDLNNVVINNSAAAGSGVTLVGTIANVNTSLGLVTGKTGSDMNIKAVSGTLTLTKGTVTTGGSISGGSPYNLLTGNRVNVKNTTASSVSVGSSISYIDGTLRRHFCTGVAGAYNWPLGVAANVGYQRALTNFTNITGTASFIDARFNTNGVPGGNWSAGYTSILGTDQCSSKYDLVSFDNGSWLFIPDITYPANSYSYDASLFPLNVTNIIGAVYTIIKRPHTSTINSTGWIYDGTCSASTSSQVNRTGLSGFSFLGVDQGANTLPIELLYFTGKNMGDYNKLEWETVSERDNDYFILEKSHDGINFEELAKVDGAGNSTVNLYYTTNDNKPYIGVNYYRLKQIDFNGNETKSNIVVLNNMGEGINISGIYPNPTSSNAEFVVSNKKKENLTYKVIDNSGRIIYQKTLNTNMGETKVEIPSSNFAMGIYNVVIAVGNENITFVEKLVKH